MILLFFLRKCNLKLTFSGEMSMAMIRAYDEYGNIVEDYEKQIYDKAIDDFVNALDEVKVCEVYDCVSFYEIEHIAEQLKS